MNAIALFRARGRRAMPWRAPFAGHAARTMPSIAPCDWDALAPSLAALGPVLHVDCLPAGGGVHLVDQAPWPARAELVGLACARGVCASVALDTDGPREGLHFLDACGVAVAGIWLLPDSDFLAWERLIEQIPSTSASEPLPRLRWRSAAAKSMARVRQFERVRLAGCELIDAITPARVSAIGMARAQLIADAVGARLELAG